MEIVVYSYGDSRDVATWSNVPYLFCRELERRGIIVHRVNIRVESLTSRFVNSIGFHLFRRLLGLKSSPDFDRTPFYRFIVDRRLKRAAREYPRADFNLFLSYSFINRYNGKKNVMWCDWPDREVIRRLGRKPAWYEKGWLKYEDRSIRDADEVYSMFRVCADNMRDYYGRDVHHLGINVVNTLYEGAFDPEASARVHYGGGYVLFVGNHLYKAGAEELIKAVGLLNERGAEFRVKIVGMTARQIFGDGDVPLHVDFYGYLRKNDEEQCRLYYDLMLNAKVFVNPTQGWGGYSSTVEAMYYGCPVIVAPYDDFVADFGTVSDFGAYHSPGGGLDCELDRILNMSLAEYEAMSKRAHERVAEYTWENYITRLLDDLRKHGVIA